MPGYCGGGGCNGCGHANLVGHCGGGGCIN